MGTQGTKIIYQKDGVKVYRFKANRKTSFTVAMETSGGETQIPGMEMNLDIMARRDVIDRLRSQDYNNVANKLVMAGFLNHGG